MIETILAEDSGLLFRHALEFATTAAPSSIAAAAASPDGVDPALWQQIGQLGWTGLVAGGLGLVECGLVFEAFARAGVASPLATAVEAGLLLRESGAADQWVTKIADGSAILTIAHVEAGGGWQPDDIALDASPAGSTYRLNGTKLLVPYAEVADALVVVARTGETVSLLLVEGGSPGYRTTRLASAGSTPVYEVRFEDCPATLLRQDAWDIVRRGMLRGAALRSAQLAGIGRAALDLTTDYVKVRVQFGRPIGTLQAVQHHCADMFRDLHACSLLAYRALDAWDRTGAAEIESSMAKAKASAVVPTITRLAHQLHGAVGYYTDYPLGRFYGDALALAAESGTATQHRRLVANWLRGSATVANRHTTPSFDQQPAVAGERGAYA